MSNVIPLAPITINMGDEDDEMRDAAITEVFDNGDVVVNVSDADDDQDDGDASFDDNLALKMQSSELATIANDLIDGIEADITSRSQWEQTFARGLDMLGLKIEQPRGDVGTTSGTIEGMSTVRSPLLLEAVLRAQSNAAGELLPSEGPAKIANDGEETKQDDEEAEFLEKDFNHYLTKTATEYYPDTRRALFWSSFGGAAFKKLYHCPLRRRPTSESVDANDLIVSNASTDLANAPRVTHRIKMRPSIMKRMQVMKAYRDVELSQPTPLPNAVDQKKEAIQGVQAQNQTRPEDQEYTLYESYCEVDIPRFAPTQFKNKALPLPYKITVDKDSREILEIRRFWKQDDEQCLRKRRIVKYPYVEAMGIYGIGLLHIMGNLTNAMTAAIREALDAGMYASFPGFIYLPAAGKQLTNEFRVAPGGGVAIQSPTGKVSDVVMPLPYHDVTPGLMSLIDRLSEVAQRLGGTADIPVGEGKQDAPVGTTLALIEQATKVESAVHKGLHQAQSEEFEILLELFREDPQAFWEHNKKPACQWDEAKLLAALDNCKLVPKADPNTPSHMHRLMKALALVQLTSNPTFAPRLNVDEILDSVIKMGRLGDPNVLILPKQDNAPAPPPLADQAKMLDAQTKAQKVQTDATADQTKAAQTAAELQTQEKIAGINLQKEAIIHGGEQKIAEQDQTIEAAKVGLAAQDQAHQHSQDAATHGLNVAKAGHDATMDQAGHALDVHQALNPPIPTTAAPKPAGKKP